MYPVELSPYSFALSSIDSEKITLTLGNLKKIFWNLNFSLSSREGKIISTEIFGSTTMYSLLPINITKNKSVFGCQGP